MKRVLRSKRGEKRARTFVIVVGVLVLAGISLFIYGLASLSNLEALTISEVKIEGAVRVDPDSLTEHVKKKLEGKLLFVFSKNNRFLYPKRVIRSEIEERYPPVKEVSLSVKKQVLTVTLVEREPHALWCEEQESGGVRATETCVYIDEGGFAFDEAPVFEGITLFTLSHASSSRHAVEGTIFLPENELLMMEEYREMLREIELDPVSFIYKKDGEGEFSVRAHTSKTVPRRILVDLSLDPEQVRSNITTSYQNQVFNERDEAGTQKRLEYIDVRLESKVFFRFVE